MPADPCTPAELLEKFGRLAGRVKRSETTAAIVEQVRSAARLPNMRPRGWPRIATPAARTAFNIRDV